MASSSAQGHYCAPNHPSSQKCQSMSGERWHKIKNINQVPHWYPLSLSPSTLPQPSYPTPYALIALAPKSPSDLGQLPQSHRKTPSHFPPQRAGEGFQVRPSLLEPVWVGGWKLMAPQTVLHSAAAAPLVRQ